MTVTDDRPTAVLGTRQLRKEDPALLTGEAKYANDLNIPGALHLVLVRSPYAHAKIKSINTAKALKVPGVLGVITALLITRSVTRPIEGAIELAEAVAAGNLTYRIEHVSRDEVGRLDGIISNFLEAIRPRPPTATKNARCS